MEFTVYTEYEQESHWKSFITLEWDRLHAAEASPYDPSHQETSPLPILDDYTTQTR